MYDDFKVANYSKALLSPELYARPLSRLYSGDVIDGLTVVPGTGLQVVLQPGNTFIRYGSAATASARIVSLVNTFNLTIPTPDVSNPRHDLVVVYIDNAVALPSGTPTTANLDGRGVAKARIVSGSPASSPSDPNNTAIQAAIGAGNPYMLVARVRTEPGVSVIAANKITDVRSVVKLAAENLDYGSQGYRSVKATGVVTLTTTNQTILSIDVSHFPTGAKLEICASVYGGGTNDLVGMAVTTNVSQSYAQAGYWGRTLSFVEDWEKTAAINSITLLARKDNATTLTAGARSLTVKRVG